MIATYSDGKFTSAEHVFTVSVEGKGLPLNIVLGATGGVLVLVIIIIVLCIVWRRRNPSHLAIYRMEDGTGKCFFQNLDLHLRTRRITPDRNKNKYLNLIACYLFFVSNFQFGTKPNRSITIVCSNLFYFAFK